MSVDHCMHLLSQDVTWTAEDWLAWDREYPHRAGLARVESSHTSRLKVGLLWSLMVTNNLASLPGFVRALERSGRTHTWTPPWQEMGRPFFNLDFRTPDAPWQVNRMSSNPWHTLPLRRDKWASEVIKSQSANPFSSGPDSSDIENYWRLRWGFALWENGLLPSDVAPAKTPPHQCASFSWFNRHPTVYEQVLLRAPESLELPSETDLSPLEVAVASGQTTMARWLLQRGAQVTTAPWTPARAVRWLEWSIQHGKRMNYQGWGATEDEVAKMNDWFELRKELAQLGLPPYPYPDEEQKHVCIRPYSGKQYDPAWHELAQVELNYGLRHQLEALSEEARVPRRRARL